MVSGKPLRQTIRTIRRAGLSLLPDEENSGCEKGLAQKSTEKKTKEELNLEEKLLAWLDQHSLIQILDWFRCVDYVATTGNDSASKWATETTKRDQLFLKLLGVS